MTVTLARRSVLAAAASAIASAACSGPRFLPPVSAAVPQAFEACAGQGARSLSLLTWNIFMMPPWIHESPRNKPRALAIAATLRDAGFDILCLQKAFDAGARSVISEALEGRYPWQYGPANDSFSLKLNSGVWILSRHPLTDYRTIQFDACSGVECWSRKGAILVSGACAGLPFRLVTAHLQGEEGPSFTAANQRVREEQMVQIRQELIEPNRAPGVPFLVCGDLGTPRFTADGHAQTVSYERMLRILDAANGPEPRITLDDCRRRNDLAIDDTGRRNELDYVLVVSTGAPVAATRTRYVFRREGWDLPPACRRDLSYRYAVGARLALDT